MQPYVLGFYGESNSGKTKIIIDLIQTLVKKGYKIATVKKTHKDIKLDSPGKDTWRHSEAGSEIVILSSLNETDIIVNEKKDIKQIIKAISVFGEYHVIIVEGADEDFIPKIRVGDIKNRTNTILTYNDNIKEIINIIINNIQKEVD